MAGWPPSSIIRRASPEDKRALAKGFAIYLAIAAAFSAPYFFLWPLAESWAWPVRIAVVAAEIGLAAILFVWWRRRRTRE